MARLLIVATSPRADARHAGRAAALGLRTDAPYVAAEEVAERPGSPLIAADHAGIVLEPQAIAAAARQADVAVAPGGLLAPLGRRYAIRDLAVELGAPVVLATRAAPGLVAEARLAAEATRAAGLAVAAIALTGWPEPPDRVLLDERALLHELTDLPVVVVGAGEQRPDWPVQEWIDAAPAAGAGSAAPAFGRAALEPYRAWAGEAPGDPRSTPRPRIMDALEDIIATEGPMLATRAYAVYNRASGGRKLTSVARAPLSSAVYWLAQERRIALTRADEIPWQEDDLVRAPDAPAVRVRELGPRTLEEVPLDEIAELMRRLGGGSVGADRLKRKVLDAYGLVRLTSRADAYLELAVGLLDGDQR